MFATFADEVVLSALVHIRP